MLGVLRRIGQHGGRYDPSTVKRRERERKGERWGGERDVEDTMSSGKLFQIFRAATGNALLPTACKRTDGTAKRSVTAERSARRPGMPATQKIGPVGV